MALRTAAWGSADDFESLVDRLNGFEGGPREIADAAAFEAALGL